MFGRLADLIAKLDRDNLRVERPDHPIFLCGGVMNTDAKSTSAWSIRDYLVRLRKIQNKLTGEVILAEAAQQIYRETKYPDLITFEEDIARIASLVLVITESAGSLAELGAFASEPVIRDSLRIMISEDHFGQESFVRYGPVKRVEEIDRERIATFPWRNHKKTGNVVKASIASHYNEICDFVNLHTDDVDNSHLYRTIPDKQIFYDILWILNILGAVPPGPLYDAVRLIHDNMSDDDIKNKLFSMRICRWVDLFSYSSKDFYYLPKPQDPYDYRYLPGQRVHNLEGEKMAILQEFKDGAKITPNILKRLQEKRAEKK